MGGAQGLTLATCQAHNTKPVSQALADYLSRRLGMGEVRFLSEISWQEAYNRIATGEIDVGWICGRPYVQLIDVHKAPIELLAAAVYAGERYQDRPVYFSDVVVRRDSRFHAFDDLRGATWAYNEPGSQSGYHITRYKLATMGETGRFFGRVVGSGAHLRSLEWLLSGVIDATAVDSTVLEWELATRPELASQIRIIDTLGPSPIPPLVVSRYLSNEMVQVIRSGLTRMHEDDDGKAALRKGMLKRFVRVTDSDYDLIRRMDISSQGVDLIVE